ncbi:hypothetical protein IQ07DRAFT_593125 [Pyrenochaeta sp. DS3sAY3a]|nr:hypothetical protein IQ07DRAFT_593125 [Pyrenochaeta sp. DS3sAY3a]
MAAILLDVVCVVLILSTPASYLSLFRGLFALQSTNGISVTAALVLALCAQSQLATMYYLWACPPFKRDGEVVPKPPQSTDYLNLVQLLVQWICSLLLLALLLVVRTRAQSGLEGYQTSPDDDNSPSNKTAITLLTLHASFCIFWALLAGTPRDDWLDLPFVTIMGVNQYVVNPIVSIATAMAFVVQHGTTRDVEGPSALNRTTLLPPMLVFHALAVSWPFRFQVPQNLLLHDNWWILTVWYPLVGWTCVNNAVIAFGQVILLYAMAGRSNGGVGLDGEREALLIP